MATSVRWGGEEEEEIWIFGRERGFVVNGSLGSAYVVEQCGLAALSMVFLELLTHEARDPWTRPLVTYAGHDTDWSTQRHLLLRKPPGMQGSIKKKETYFLPRSSRENNLDSL